MLLDVCCAPCALPILEYLLLDLEIEPKNLVLYYYNPNIWPKEEWERRLEGVEKIASIYHLQLLQEKYNHQKWLRFIKKSLPQPPAIYPENSRRCLACFRFRLDQAASFAKAHGFKEFGTTLSVSLFKDIDFINFYGEALARKHQLKYKKFPLDAREAKRKSLELSKKYNLYRQKYCGCEFSFKSSKAD